MDLSLNDEQQAFRDLARDFLDREAVPHRTQWDRDESVDLAIVPIGGRCGWIWTGPTARTRRQRGCLPHHLRLWVRLGEPDRAGGLTRVTARRPGTTRLSPSR